MNCIACGGMLEERPYVHEEEVGGVVVRNGRAQQPTCTTCGEVYISAHELALYELRAAAVVLRDGRRVNGDVLRYARRALGLRQTDLARELQLGPEWISRSETGAIVATRAHQLAIVALLDGAFDGLMNGEPLPAPVSPAEEEPLEVPPLPEVGGARG